MAFYTADGAVVNAAPPSPTIQGAANVAATLSASAAPVRTAFGTGVALATAAVSPNLTYNHKTTVAEAAVGSVELFLSPSKIHDAAIPDASATASITAFVTRDVVAFSIITGTGSVVAIPADKIGSGDVTTTTTVTGDATRIVRARSASGATSTVTSTTVRVVKPVVTLSASTAIIASAGINGVYTGVATVTGQGSVTADPVNFKNPADVLTSVVVEAQGTSLAIRTQRARSRPLSIASIVLAEPSITALPFSNTGGTGAMTASATRVRFVSGDTGGQADVNLLQPKQRHAAIANVSGAGTIVFSPTRLLFATDELLTVTATVVATGVIIKVPEVDPLGGTGALTAEMITLFQGETNVAPTATTTADAVRVVEPEATVSPNGAATAMLTIVKPSNATISAPATTTSEGVILRAAIAQPILALVEMSGVGGYVRQAAVDVTASGLIYADTIANPESEDPERRVFIKPPQNTEFVRPPEDLTYIRRSA